MQTSRKLTKYIKVAAYNQEVKVVVTTMWPQRFFYSFAGSTPVAASINHKSANDMETTIAHNNIVGTIREMNIGDEVQFPIEKTPYIRVALYNHLMPERQAGCRWTTLTDKEEGTVIVKRIA